MFQHLHALVFVWTRVESKSNTHSFIEGFMLGRERKKYAITTFQLHAEVTANTFIQGFPFLRNIGVGNHCERLRISGCGALGQPT